jgi:transketolase
MRYLLSHARPVYLRLCRQPLPEVTGAAMDFTFGRPTVLASGQDVVIFAMGGTVAVVMEALPGLARYGVHPTVVNVSSLPVAAGRCRSRPMR